MRGLDEGVASECGIVSSEMDGGRVLEIKISKLNKKQGFLRIIRNLRFLRRQAELEVCVMTNERRERGKV